MYGDYPYEIISMHDVFAQLGAIDIRDRLPRRNWIIGTRSATTSITFHWSGPPVPPDRQRGPGLITQLQIDSVWQMRPGWGGTRDGAPHLMYHMVIDADGQFYQTASPDEILWHCAHGDGNARGLALHFPLGAGQAVTGAQLLTALRVTNILRVTYGIPKSRVLGHQEWKHATLCPGPDLMLQLMRYRGAATPPIIVPTPTPPGLRRWQLRSDLIDNANVRQGPGVGFKIAGRMKPGTVLFIDTEQDAEPADAAHPRWVHLARVAHEQADLGFLAAELGAYT